MPGTLSVIVSQVAYWTAWEASVLYAPLTVRDVRTIITSAGLSPAGCRPPQGRGRPAFVYDADVLAVLLG
jgi:hypothetical protein